MPRYSNSMKFSRVTTVCLISSLYVLDTWATSPYRREDRKAFFAKKSLRTFDIDGTKTSGSASDVSHGNVFCGIGKIATKICAPDCLGCDSMSSPSPTFPNSEYHQESDQSFYSLPEMEQSMYSTSELGESSHDGQTTLLDLANEDTIFRDTPKDSLDSEEDCYDTSPRDIHLSAEKVNKLLQTMKKSCHRRYERARFSREAARTFFRDENGEYDIESTLLYWITNGIEFGQPDAFITELLPAGETSAISAVLMPILEAEAETLESNFRILSLVQHDNAASSNLAQQLLSTYGNLAIVVALASDSNILHTAAARHLLELQEAANDRGYECTNSGNR